MKNNKPYIILAVFIFLSLFLLFFLIFPLFNEIKKNSAELVSAKDSIATLVAQNSETQNFENNYENYKPNLAKVDQLFIDSENPVDFIRFLEDTADIYKITSKVSLPPSDNIKNTNRDFIIFQFSSKGIFSNILNFAKSIETGLYLIEIENLNIQNSSNQTDKNIFKNYSLRQVEAVFTIKAFTK